MQRSLRLLMIFIVSSCSYNSLEELTLDCTSDPMTISTKTENSDCGLGNGMVTIVVSGGNSPYQYEISGLAQSENVFSNLTPGNYQVKAISESGCSVEADFVILNIDGVQATAISSDAGCGTFQATITITAQDGVSPYQYSLNGGVLQSNSVFNNLGAGIQTILVKDQNGCEFTLEQAILTGVSYSQVVEPIIMNNCAVIGCHSGSQSPDFRMFDNVKTNSANIRSRTQSGSMPAGGGSLTQEQIDAIACWIDDGALNN